LTSDAGQRGRDINMVDKDRVRFVYVEASKILDATFEFQPNSSESEEFKEAHNLRTIACIIHNDLLRGLYCHVMEPALGIAVLLGMADMAKKMFEAKDWFMRDGNVRLINLAEKRGYKREDVSGRIRAMKKRHQLGRLEKYSTIRHKLSAHYDPNCVDALREFAHMNSDEFFDVLGSFSRYAHEWLDLLRAVMGLHPLQPVDANAKT
jgi:hypothetical protein